MCWVKPAQLLRGWFPVYTFWAECQSKSQLVERGSTYGNCSSISGLNLSADRPSSDNFLNHLMGIPLSAVAIPTFMILLRWICEFWEVCCGFSNGAETFIIHIPWNVILQSSAHMLWFVVNIVGHPLSHTAWVFQEDVFKVWRDDGILLEPCNFIVGNGVS